MKKKPSAADFGVIPIPPITQQFRDFVRTFLLPDAVKAVETSWRRKPASKRRAA